MKKQNRHYRQGDVLLQLIDSLLKGLSKIAREKGRLVLAHGKSTGHSHAVPTLKCDLFADPKEAGGLYLRVAAKTAELVHDEHTAIDLPKGVYRVCRQREFSADTIRRVED